MKRRWHYARIAWSRFLKILQNPFDDILYLILLWVINSLPSLLEHIINGNFKYAIYITLLYYALTYIIVCLLDINKYVEKILKPIVFIGSYLFLLINIYVLKTYNYIISYHIVEIIKESNMREVCEYLDAYMSTDLIIQFFTSVFLGVVICYVAIKFRTKNNVIRLSLGILMLVALTTIWHNRVEIKSALYTNRWIGQMDELIKLENHLTSPNISVSDSITPPRYVIIIIGESFTPLHSSLYGYDKDTNPRLRCLADNGDLVVYGRVTSPKTNTTATFRYLLNAFRIGMESEYKWYESTTLIEVLNTADYHTAWLSNQEERGLYDNLPSGHSRLCDEAVFTTNDADGHKYDGALIDVEIPDTGNRQAVFYHLIGQHVEFKLRYSQEYDIFKSKDYQCHLRNEKQARILAEYDNATLYNDMVVSSIIDKYKHADAVVFYLSDHGLELFETDSEYFGHARNTPASQAVGKKIPFMVYMSPLYRKLRPTIAERIIQAAHEGEDFCTDKLIYAVMDATGIEFADNDDVARYSLFSTAGQ